MLGGRWTLARLIGVGGTAAVYEAKHRNGKQVAIKVLNPARAENPASRRRFLREAHAANRVGHPSVVAVDDDGEEADGTTFLVMELLPSESLEAFARRAGGRLPWPAVAGICLELLEVLEAAHVRGIIHRDIKPANLSWSPGGPLRVLDFGLARFIEGTEPDHDLSTHDGAVLGTPAFMAPEQARAASSAIRQQTDIYAVGATAFALLTGRTVHEAPSLEEQLAVTSTKSAPALKRHAPDVPEAVAEVFQRALAYDASDRWPEARAMLDALRAAVGRADAHASSATPEATTFVDTLGDDAASSARKRAPARSRRAWIAAGVAAGALSIGAGWLRLREISRPAPHRAPEVADERTSVTTASAPAATTSQAVHAATVSVPAAEPSHQAAASPAARPRQHASSPGGAKPPAPRMPAPSASSPWIEEPPF